MKKNILFLTTQLPFPPHSGGIIKSFRTLKHIAKNNEVDVACLLKSDNKDNIQDLRNEVTFNNLITHEIDIKRNAINIIKANLQLMPISFYRNYSKNLAHLLENKWKKYDIIFVDHVEMFQYIPKAYFEKTILHQHNAEFLMWQRAAEIEKNPLKKLILYIQACLIKKQEKQYCNAAKCILASPNDEEKLKNIGVQNTNFYTTFHLGDDSLIDAPALKYNIGNQNLLYIGTLTWEANIDGLLWFFDEIWKPLLAQNSNITFTIIGKNPDKRIIEKVKNESQVLLKGFVEDVEPYFKNANCFVVPLRFGSGIKVKVISTMYRGLPCVTTSIGTEGMEIENGKHIFIANDAEAFATSINNLLHDAEKWKILSEESRKIAIEKYSWQAVFDTIDEVILKIN
jgi:glycosyltransferase involved in cell wall biosynthesis